MRPQYLQTHAVLQAYRDADSSWVHLGRHWPRWDPVRPGGSKGERCFFQRPGCKSYLCSESSVRYHFIYLFPTSWCFDTSKGILLQHVKHECCTPLRGFPLAMVDEGCVHGLRGLDGLTVTINTACCRTLLFFAWVSKQLISYNTKRVLEVAFYPFAAFFYCKLLYLPQPAIESVNPKDPKVFWKSFM